MKNDRNFKIKLVLLWVFAFSVMIFIMSMSANAEEPYFPMQQNENSILTNYVLNFINNDSQIDVENNYVATGRYEVVGNYTQIYIICVSKSNNYIFAEKLSNGYQFSYYLLNSNSYTIYQIKYRTSNPSDVYKNSIGSLVYFQNLNSSLYDTSISYASNLRIYTSANDDKQLVLKYGPDDPDPIGIGVAIIPPEPIIPEYLTGDSAPQNVPPEYTINNYTWTTAPQFDGSTVINGIQSIKDTLEWLSSNLHEELANLLNNIKGLATYIGKTIQYYGNTIIETINNAIQNFYDNMKALVEPIYTTLENLYNGFLEFADLFIHPFDEEEFESQMESCELINQYNELMDNADDIRAIFNNAEERDYFVLYIDFENPFADSEHKIIHSEISFTWLKNYRSSYRPFLWLFTMIECFVGGMRLLGGIIGGKAK